MQQGLDLNCEPVNDVNTEETSDTAAIITPERQRAKAKEPSLSLMKIVIKHYGWILAIVRYLVCSLLCRGHIISYIILHHILYYISYIILYIILCIILRIICIHLSSQGFTCKFVVDWLKFVDPQIQK